MVASRKDRLWYDGNEHEVKDCSLHIYHAYASLSRSMISVLHLPVIVRQLEGDRMIKCFA